QRGPVHVAAGAHRRRDARGRRFGRERRFDGIEPHHWVVRPASCRKREVTYTGLLPSRLVLDNGAVVLAKRASMTPAVAIHLAVGAGSTCDPAGAPGMTWLLSRVIDRGTASRSAADIAEELDSRGITLTVTVTRHRFSLICTCLADDFEPVIALL